MYVSFILTVLQNVIASSAEATTSDEVPPSTEVPPSEEATSSDEADLFTKFLLSMEIPSSTEYLLSTQLLTLQSFIDELEKCKVTECEKDDNVTITHTTCTIGKKKTKKNRLDVDEAYNYYSNVREDTDFDVMPYDNFQLSLESFKYAAYNLFRIFDGSDLKDLESAAKNAADGTETVLSNLSACNLDFSDVEHLKEVSSKNLDRFVCYACYKIIREFFLSNENYKKYLGLSSYWYNYKYINRPERIYFVDAYFDEFINFDWEVICYFINKNFINDVSTFKPQYRKMIKKRKYYNYNDFWFTKIIRSFGKDKEDAIMGKVMQKLGERIDIEIRFMNSKQQQKPN